MGKYPNYGKRQFTEREKRAYSAGCGYAAAKAGKRVDCKTEKEKESFRNGVKSVRERKKRIQDNNCGHSNKKPAIVAGITADGEIVKV